MLVHVIGHNAGCPYQLVVGEAGASKRGATLHFAICICSIWHGEDAGVTERCIDSQDASELVEIITCRQLCSTTTDVAYRNAACISLMNGL